MGDFQGNFDRRRSRSRSDGGPGRGRSDRGRSGGFDRDSPREFGGRGRGRSGGFGGRDRRPEMHEAVCDKCGNDCEVPFRPTEGKPIYCDNCFKDKSREAGSRSEIGKPKSNENIDQINKKLDKILKILEGKKEPVEKKEKQKKIEKQPDLEEPKSVEEEEPKLEYAKSEEKKKKAKEKSQEKEIITLNIFLDKIPILLLNYPLLIQL